MKLSVPLFQADQEFVGPFGGNFFQTQPSVKSTNVMRHNSKAQDLQENSKRPPKKQTYAMQTTFICKLWKLQSVPSDQHPRGGEHGVGGGFGKV